MFYNDKDSLLNSFFSISRKLFLYLYSKFEKDKLYPGQHQILILLLKENKLTQKEISERVCVKPSTITVTIDNLLKNGLISKNPSEKDRRIYYITLTKKGEELANSALNVLNQIENYLNSLLNEDEKKIVLSFFNKIIDRFSKELKCEKNK
jgi:DNA-binding MarR family transcriptional regulator